MKKKFAIRKHLQLRTGFVVFLLFFGISALEAFRTRNWMGSIFWVVIAIMFLIADNITKEEDRNEPAN